MVARKPNSNTFNTYWSTIHGPVLFIEVRVTNNGSGAPNFTADLVADPNNPADVAAAIGSDLEILTEKVMDYTTILGLAVDGTYAEFIVPRASDFNDAAAAQDLFDRLVDDLGWTVANVLVTEAFNAYPFQAPT